MDAERGGEARIAAATVREHQHARRFDRRSPDRDGRRLTGEFSLHVDRIDDLAATHEYRARAAQSQQLSADARILHHVDDPAIRGAHGERIDDEKCLELGLDREQAFEFLHHDTYLASTVPITQMRRFFG